MSRSKTYASVWDAIADTPEEAANLRARAELMQKIAALLKQREWTQAEAASRCGEPLRRHPATDQRPAPGPRLALLARRTGQHRYGPGLSSAR